jgi:hypothetical protein
MYLIACFNIEKNGQSSFLAKQEKVSEFIDACTKLKVDVLFLCEVHSARVEDYRNFIASVYGGYYLVFSLPGGHSNAYIVMVKAAVSGDILQNPLKGLTRGAVVIRLGNDLAVCLAHFKSGQTGLTRDQIEQASAFLDGAFQCRWVIAGDMNWDFANRNQLTLPGGTHAHTCWTDQTQIHGGILDWCLAGGLATVEKHDLTKYFRPEMFAMDGPDHKPILFSVGPT